METEIEAKFLDISPNELRQKLKVLRAKFLVGVVNALFEMGL